MSRTTKRLISHCFWCNRKFRAKPGGGYFTALLQDPIGNKVQVHKHCVSETVADGYKEIES